MGILDFLKKKPAEEQPEAAPVQLWQGLSPKLREYLERGSFRWDDEIKAQTKWIDLGEISVSAWSRIRYLRVSDWHSFEASRCRISHDGTCLFVPKDSKDVDTILSRYGENLIYLRIDRQLEAPLDLSHMKQLKYLRIGVFHDNSGRVMELSGLEGLSALETLYLDGTFDFMALDLTRMKALKTLEIKSNQRLQTVEGLSYLCELKTLSFYKVPGIREMDFSGLYKLELLQLGNMPALSRISALDEFHKLRYLWLYRNAVDISSVDLSGMRFLEALSLDHLPRLWQIDGLEKLEQLTKVDISYTPMRRIPEGLRGKPLNRLDLSGLELEALPDWLPELGLEFTKKGYGNGIRLENTTVDGVDMSIFDQPQEMILQWFESRKKDDAVPLQEVKVVFLGDGEAGKTHTIARLLNDGNEPLAEHFDDKATPGIVIRDKPYVLDGAKIKVHYWDFGGQEILHSMHRMFLTERTLYVVLINARDDTQDDRARYWLHNIRSFAGNSPVLLVLNKIDQNPNASINETELRELYGGLRQVVRLSALHDSREQFNAALTDALMDEIRSLGTIGTLWPSSWAKLKTSLETMKTNFITGTEYKQMCRDSGVEKSREELLHWFNDLGVSFFYQGSRRLEHYVILRPEWITNGIYILLFNRSEETKNGLIPMDAIYEMLKPEDEDTYRRVLRGVTYDVHETDYVLEVMRKFRLSYNVSGEKEFIPALCQRDSMPIAKQYAEAADALEFRMTYDYLPDNVIHRLMVEMWQDLQLSDVWRTGALFRQQGTGLSAVVKSEGDVLRIFVRSENSMHRPNTYLCILKENIDRINRDMKLKAPLAEVIYKTPQGSDCFDYEDLLNALADGEDTYRSKKLRRQIPIRDILNQTGRGVELELQQLREDLVTACMQLQGNPMYWGSTEDQRNTFLRDVLRSRDYLVNDQSFQGVGGGRRGYGELDLEIRREKDIPWTILEALRIKDGSKTEWNRHLKKLLDNYNPSGLNHLFLLTYVDSSKDDFDEILGKFSEHIRWHDADDYIRMPNTFSHVPLRRHGDPAYLRVMRCTYDRNGAPTTVTHIFVRIGE